MSTELTLRSSTDLVPAHTRIAAATPAAIDKVNELAAAIRERLEPVQVKTEHLVHGLVGGYRIYTRTIRLPAGATCAAALLKVPTTLIFEGVADVWSNDVVTRVEGYTVIEGSAGRKIGFKTITAVKMSMMLITDLTDIAEIQRQFTDEHAMLVPLSVEGAHDIRVTGE